MRIHFEMSINEMHTLRSQEVILQRDLSQMFRIINLFLRVQTPCLTCGDLGWTDSSSSCSIVAINCSRCDFRQSCVSASSVDSTCSIQDPQGHDLEIGLGVGIGGGGLLILALVSAILVAVLMRKKGW